MAPFDERSSAAVTPAACWSCAGPVDAVAVFCATCKAVQPPRSLDHFTRLGLPVAFALDEAELDRRYFQAQRQLHPDRFATKTPRERAISQNQAVSLNEAYESLREPLTRAAYLLELKGVAASGEHTVKDPALLMEQMERREALSDAATPSAVDALAAQAAADIKASEATIAAAFAADDLAKAHAETTRLKYLVKLAAEARVRKAKLTAAG